MFDFGLLNLRLEIMEARNLLDSEAIFLLAPSPCTLADRQRKSMVVAGDGKLIIPFIINGVDFASP
jgi:hypothetical protein